MFNASFLLCFGSLFKARNTNYRHIARPKQKKNRPTSNAKQQHKVSKLFILQDYLGFYHLTKQT